MNKHMGSNFNDFLEGEGILPESEAEAAKRVIAWQIQNYLDINGLKKSAFAKEMHTSRSQLDRLLDPTNTSINLTTLVTAANAMGKHLEIKIKGRS
jgi:antitoxin HicB